MTEARVRQMPGTELDEWRADRDAAGTPLPEPYRDEQHEAVVVAVGGVDVGGALLAYGREGAGLRCAVRVLQTTLPHDAAGAWTSVASVLATHARDRGATELATAVAPALATAFGRAGFQATMFGTARTLDPDVGPDLQQDRRVSVRPMDADERRRFVGEARALLHSGMARAGVADPASSRLEELETRLVRLGDDPAPDGELLLTAVLDDRPIGGMWATLVTGEEGTDLHGHTLHLFPEFRGQRLSRSFLGAVARHLTEKQVRLVRARVYGYDRWARSIMIPDASRVTEVHLRKDLR
ncbi:hypothetical protein SAMN04487968_107128 [Nocardioides terrae]|uniref:N-acetyltransferase domain-containing protein n=1 Tax=Nocardioides terrae TaxID=574651 RepID=A0A1I1JSC1_9ACTN|nr:hypothetical protein [Nocardioides terrae]SFC51406.1 hypothetical protein SAMN04487968_107128 [Nocardioides terrae]